MALEAANTALQKDHHLDSKAKQEVQQITKLLESDVAGIKDRLYHLWHRLDRDEPRDDARSWVKMRSLATTHRSRPSPGA